MSTLEERAAARRNRAVVRLNDDMHTVDRQFDVAFWQAQGSEAIFAAAWQLVQDRRRFLGLEGDEPRLQRHIGGLVR